MNEALKCPDCGTEYPKGVEAEDGSCDWCPGVKPQPIAQPVEAVACAGG